MASAANSAAAYEGTGAGGKYPKKKPFKRSSQTTPYDRPVTSLRPTQIINNNNSSSNGWFSKIVDPASKLITAGAHKLFSSVFRKRLLPPPVPSSPSPSPPPQQQQQKNDERQENMDMQQDTAKNVVASATEEPVVYGGDDASNAPECRGVTELEGLLKQKTFTRSEIDHLTALLISRAAEDSAGAEKGGSDVLGLPVRHEKLSHLRIQDNRTGHVLPAAISTPEVRSKVRSKVLEHDVASPAEIAKAYMGSRPAKVSSSESGLQNHRPKEGFPASYNPLMTPRSSAMTIFQKSVTDNGHSSNGFVTPRFRGRSAIYSMARTPYSRNVTATSYKAAESNFNGGCGSSPYNKSAESNKSDRQVLKRRSSVLENDIGSVGPIRRIRQKPNLMHPKTLSLPPSARPRATCPAKVSSDVVEVPPSLERTLHNHSMSTVDSNMASTSSGYVPLQSIEMAHKIFEQLGKFTPEGKSPHTKSGISVENSSTKIEADTLDGPVRKGMETINSLKYLGSTRESRTDSGKVNSVGAVNHSPNMSSAVERLVGKRPVLFSENQASKNGEEERFTESHPSQEINTVDFVMTLPSSEPPHKKRSFQMSAHEDFPDMDDDVPSSGGALSTSLAEGREFAELSGHSPCIPNDTLDETAAVKKLEAPDTKASASSFLSKVSESLANGSAPTKSAPGFSVAVTVPEPVSAFQSTLDSDKVLLQNDKSTFPAFVSKPDKSSQFSSDAPSAAVACADMKDNNLEALNSAIDATAKANGPDKADSKTPQVAGYASLKFWDSSSVKSSDKPPFSFGLLNDSATPSNGPFSSLPTTSAVSSPFQLPGSVSNGDSKLANGNAEAKFACSTAVSGIMFATATSTSTTAFSASSSPLPSSETVPSLSSGSALQGSVPSTAPALATSASESTMNSGAKSNDTAFGNAAISAKPSPGGFEGSSSGFGTSDFKFTSGEPRSVGAPVSSGSIFNFQASSCGTLVSTLASSFPSQSASSVSTTASTSVSSLPSLSASSVSASPFGFTAPSSFSSSASLGVSSASPFSSGSTSSVPTASSTATSNTSSIFGSTWQSPKSAFPVSTTTAASPSSGSVFGLTSPGSIFGLAPSGSSGAATNTSVFGAPNSSSTATTTTSVFGMTSSSPAPGPFVFGSSTGSGTSNLSAPSPATSTSIFQPQSSFRNAGTSAFPFAAASSGNNDQMTMEDSMAEDSMHQPTHAVPVLGAPAPAPSNPFVFGTGAPSGSSFQFNSQPNPFAPQNPSPFQASSSVEFNPGGSFTVGSLGSTDKSQRKIVKVKRRNQKR